MDTIGEPRGLIRYSSRHLLSGDRTHWLRPRTVLYPMAFLLCFGTFVYQLTVRDAADITVLGTASGAPFSMQNAAQVSNAVRVRIANRTALSHPYTVRLVDADDATLIAPMNGMRVDPGHTETMPFFVLAPTTSFHHGTREIALRVTDGAGFTTQLTYRLRGPVRDDDDDHGAER
jgi:polyferredoxin